MSLLSRVRIILNLFLHRRTVEADLDEEVQGFYEAMVERYMMQGLTEMEARRLARIKFGHPEKVKEQVRDTRAGSILDAPIRNLNYAIRGMSKAPVFAIVTMLTLGVGIGANATVFSIVSRFVLQHRSVDPATLLAIHTTQGGGQCCNNFSWLLYKICANRRKRFPVSRLITICCQRRSVAQANRNVSGDRLSLPISSMSPPWEWRWGAASPPKKNIFRRW